MHRFTTLVREIYKEIYRVERETSTIREGYYRMNRNLTDGLFGLYLYFEDELFLEKIQTLRRWKSTSPPSPVIALSPPPHTRRCR